MFEKKGTNRGARTIARRILGGLCALSLVLVALGAVMPAQAETHVFPKKETTERMYSRVEPEIMNGFLPVCYSAKASGQVVAFTIDDCNQANNLRDIIKLFKKYGGTATIFPIGENVSFLKDILKSAWEDGFEIENHTWDHSGLYHENDQGMVNQIWSQNRAVSEALGVSYQMHFLRPRGGDNRYDQRTHAYLRQLGYYGIAYWSKVGVLQSTDYITRNIRSGDILLFHTTADDLAQLKELVP